MRTSKSQQRHNYWQQQIEQWHRSGHSGMQFCREHDLSYHCFTYWRKKLAEKPSTSPVVEAEPRTSKFTKVVQTSTADAGADTGGLVMTLPNGVSFRGVTDSHIDLIGQLLQKL
ncbi:MAG: IS66 family insertion sequence element accessory protein TnpB [Gammaproteobacteria bacterium]|jgi:hypothetical protein|nr:IS66 family insertion sequence element accessory protein TnpB [Gammaproteobacteria bacterium]MBT4607654.1 IS66 family insertion sequence element accessory protein TnpB [Thiotrichales bacterium]MBT3966829.1 IS66 family insertion sequence element accessory protein TnpB [Gammaproteobacteria bacterium]MBT4079901.1 IS66 family insertion sequence element accessory protein TnpB [Gammaproteobacteria bacterium]MBT4329850.1 IS66 family insertion sequence element accessory protein TnpB [Gammaproteobact